MTGPEKRYFKVHGTSRCRDPQNGQQRLFDAVASMETYDEAALLKRYRSTRIADHFNTAKHRLYEAVLKSLSAYHAERSSDARIAKLLHHVELLHDRALYIDAERILASAKRLAQQQERQPAHHAVLQWEQRLLERSNYAYATEEKLMLLAEEGRLLVQRAAELDQLWHLKSTVFTGLYRDGQARSPKGSHEAEALMQHPLMRHPEKLKSARARFLYHHVRSAAAFAAGERTSCIAELECAYRVLEEERGKFAEEPNLALSTLSNLIYMKVNEGRFDEAFALLQDFRLLPGRWNMPETEDLDLKLFATSTSLELAVHNRMGRFDKAIELQPVVERGLVQHEMQLGAMRKASLFYQLAYAHLGAGRPDRSLRWTHELLNEVRIDDNAEIVCFGRILQLMAHVDAGDRTALPYALRNTQRFLNTRARMYRFEPLVLALVRTVLKARDSDVRREAFATFLERATPLEADPFERVVFEHLDPLAWATSKLTGRSFADHAQERAKGKALAA